VLGENATNPVKESITPILVVFQFLIIEFLLGKMLEFVGVSCGVGFGDSGESDIIKFPLVFKYGYYLNQHFLPAFRKSEKFWEEYVNNQY
jgi:hypothetical protein